jgi:DNA ligase (NAD+)
MVKSSPIQAPTNCPSCSATLVLSKTGVDLYCPNTQNCKAQIIGRLSYFCQRNLGNITGLSDKIIERLVNDLNIRDVPDLYNLPWDIIVQWEGFGEKSVSNLKESIEKSRQEIPDYKFLAGVGIEGIGPEIAKLICNLVEIENQESDSDMAQKGTN